MATGICCVAAHPLKLASQRQRMNGSVRIATPSGGTWDRLPPARGAAYLVRGIVTEGRDPASRLWDLRGSVSVANRARTAMPVALLERFDRHGLTQSSVT